MARGTIVISVDRCKGCELCTLMCPQAILHMSRSRMNGRGYRPVELVDPNRKCTGCALCTLACPDAVITVYRYDPKLEPQRTEQVADNKTNLGPEPSPCALMPVVE